MLGVAMNTQDFHVVEFTGTTEAAAFVAALSRFVNSPRGAACGADLDAIAVLVRSIATRCVVDVYLNEDALKAASAAFAPVPVVRVHRGLEHIARYVSLIGPRPTPAWGLDDVRRLLESP
jgi:hypothetical protein